MSTLLQKYPKLAEMLEEHGMKVMNQLSRHLEETRKMVMADEITETTIAEEVMDRLPRRAVEHLAEVVNRGVSVEVFQSILADELTNLDSM
jgi:hypothetical protein